jgi:hypothetical protein
MPGSYESIATVTVGSGGAANVTFSNIPSTFTHLQLRISAKWEGSAEQISGRFNSDSGNNYAYHQIYGTGSTVAAGAGTSQNHTQGFGYLYGGSNTQHGVSVIDILDYSNTNKYTTIRSLSGYDENGSGLILFRSGLWMNTAAVSSILLYAGSDWAENSKIALYGVN